MRDFACPACSQRLAFENSLCLNCRNHVGFDPERRMSPGRFVGGI